MGLSEFPNFDATMRLRLAAAVDRLAGEFARERLRAQIGAALLTQQAGSAVAPV